MRRFLPLLLLLTCCSNDGLVKVKIGPAYRGMPVLFYKDNPTLEDGDKELGRRVFIQYGCVDCHRVAEDPKLPLGKRAIAQPPLEHLGRVSAYDLKNRILDRNTGKGVTLNNREMGEYVERLSARALVDVIAYLRDPRQPKLQ
jgi:hypothetical protein